MRPFEKILTPVDFSESSRRAVRYTLEMARALGSEAHFLHVAGEPSLVSRLAPGEAGEADGVRETQEQALSEFLASEGVGGRDHRALTLGGAPGPEIVRYARTQRADVIVMGTHGVAGLEAHILGGTSHHVLRWTPCPVLSLKPEGYGSFLARIWDGLRIFGLAPGDTKEIPCSATFPPRSILHSTDFSETSTKGLRLAVALAVRTDARLIVLHIENDSPTTEAGFGEDATCDDPARGFEEVQLLIRALGEGLEPILMRCCGRPSAVILEQIVETGADLVVMGTERIGGLSPLGLGSTASQVVRRAPCPVLTVRPDTRLRTIDERFRKIYRSLPFYVLQAPDSPGPDDTPDTSIEALKSSELFLGFYSRRGLARALEEYGFFRLLEKRGFDDFSTTFDLSDPFRQSLFIHHGGKRTREHLLVETVLSHGHVRAQGAEAEDRRFPVLVIEWLCLQNPTARFCRSHPPMPGQDHPGLGVAREVLELLILMAERLGKAGLVNRPQHFHNAFYYHEVFRFLDPMEEGRFVAMIRDCAAHDLTDISWGVHLGCLRDERTGEVVAWTGRDQVLALDEALRSCFDAPSYRHAVWAAAAEHRFVFDREAYESRMSQAWAITP